MVAGRAATGRVNHKDVVYPRLWIQLWRTLVGVTLALVAGAGIVALGEAYGYVRAIVGMAAVVGALWFGFRYWSGVGALPPGTLEEDVDEPAAGAGRRYVCTVCGLELRLEGGGTGQPPRHCREAMVLVEDEGRPPLRPV